MVICSVPNCGNRSDRRSGRPKERQILLEQQLGRSLSFHVFPANENLRAQWVEAVGRLNWEPTKNSRVCSFHFSQDCYYKYAGGRVILKPDSVPTIFNLDNPKLHVREEQSQSKSSIQILAPGIQSVASINRASYKTGNPKAEPVDLAEKLKANCFCAVLGCSNLKPTERDIRLRQSHSWKKNTASLLLRNPKKTEPGREQLQNSLLADTDDKIFFYEFPRNEELRKKWIEATGCKKIKNIPKKTTICSDHFDKSCFYVIQENNIYYKSLRKDAIPSILPTLKIHQKVEGTSISTLVRNHTPSTPKFDLKSTFDLKDELQKNLVKIYNDKVRSILGKEQEASEIPTMNSSSKMNASQFLEQIKLGNVRTSHPHSSSSGILKAALTNGNVTSNISIPLKGTSNISNVRKVPLVTNFSSADISAKSHLTIKNDLKQPVVIVEAPGKLIVTPVKSVEQNRLASMPNTSRVQVNPNSCITVSSCQSKRKAQKPAKLVDCTCPKDKFFIDGNKRIRVLTEREHRLRTRCMKNARIIKALQLSRNRGEEMVEELKGTLKELRRDVDRRLKPDVASQGFLKFCKEYLEQTKRPENPDSKYKYGRQLKKFSMQLYSCSPQAYAFVREVFNKFLPHSSTVRLWNSNKQKPKGESSLQNSNVETENEEQRIDECYDSDSNADLESVTSVCSAGADEKSLEKALQAEVKAEIDCKLDSEGNILSEVPFDMEDESESDPNSDSDFEMSFNTLCDDDYIIQSRINSSSTETDSKSSTTVAPKVGKQSKDKFNTIIKVNSDIEPGIVPGVVFETFAI